MDFPSREEARMLIQLSAESGGSVETPATVPAGPVGAGMAGGDPETTATGGLRFQVEKPGLQSDVFDRRGIRNLIRTRQILETDPIRVDNSEAMPAGDLPYLRSLFKLAKAQKVWPPACCWTHTDKVAFFRCHDSGRPLCEECAPQKKFGGSNLRVCQHCGGTAEDLLTA